MEISSALAPQLQTAASGAESQRKVGNQTLDASDFLEILVTEMTHQDPLDPMNDKEFIAQMAQFSSLEEMSNLNSTMASFVQQQQASASSAYLGKEVTLSSAGSASGVEPKGLVTAVSSANAEGTVKVTVNGTEYDVKQIKEVRLPANSGVL